MFNIRFITHIEAYKILADIKLPSIKNNGYNDINNIAIGNRPMTFNNAHKHLLPKCA